MWSDCGLTANPNMVSKEAVPSKHAPKEGREWGNLLQTWIGDQHFLFSLNNTLLPLHSIANGILGHLRLV